MWKKTSYVLKAPQRKDLPKKAPLRNPTEDAPAQVAESSLDSEDVLDNLDQKYMASMMNDNLSLETHLSGVQERVFIPGNEWWKEGST